MFLIVGDREFKGGMERRERRGIERLWLFGGSEEDGLGFGVKRVRGDVVERE